MNENIIIALDLATKNSGWCIYKDDQLIAHGVINAGSSNLFKRIDRMKTEIKKLLDIYKPTRAVIEEVLPEDVKNNQKVFKALIYLQAFIMHLMDEYNIETELVEASHWRKCCGIKTGAGVKRTSLKFKDVQFVQKIFGLQVGDDEADAICIGYASTHPPLSMQDDDIFKDEFGFEFA